MENRELVINCHYLTKELIRYYSKKWDCNLLWASYRIYELLNKMSNKKVALINNKFILYSTDIGLLINDKECWDTIQKELQKKYNFLLCGGIKGENWDYECSEDLEGYILGMATDFLTE